MIMETLAFRRAIINPEHKSKNLPQTGRGTLPGHDEAGYAVWDAGAGSQESDAHDDVRDSESEANYGDLGRENERSVEGL